MRRMTWLALLLAQSLVTSTASAADYAKDVKDAVNSIDKDALFDHLTVLASDRYEGRFTGSRHGKWASDYIAGKFQLYGLTPAGNEGYFFNYALEASHVTGQPTEGTLTEACWAGSFVPRLGAAAIGEVNLGDDFAPLAESGQGRRRGPLIFAGYGVVDPAYDDYQRLEVFGAVVIVIDADPIGPAAPAGRTRAEKIAAARAKGAQAIIFVPSFEREDAVITDDAAPAVAPSPAAPWPPQTLADPKEIIVARVSAAGRDRLLGPLVAKVKGYERAIIKSAKPSAKELPLDLEIAVFAEKETFARGRNVVAIWPAKYAEVADEVIVISAHYDHIGRGRIGRVKGNEGEIYNGTDDNASGTSGLIEIARALHLGKVELDRTIMLIAFDSEEIGLVGSKQFTDAPTVPLEKILADLNMDMICKGHPTKMYVGGRDSSVVIDQILTRISNRFNLTLVESGMEQYINRSDQANFLRHGIPAIFLFGGIHAEYHSPDDDFGSSSLHTKKMETIAKLMLLVAVEISQHPGKP